MSRVLRTVSTLCLTGLLASHASAGIVTGGSLLASTDADQLETWLGVGDQDFTNIWSGTAGVSTAADFHAAVDGAGPTFSIYEAAFQNTTIRIGGYTTLDWGGTTGYAYDSEAFIFNLDSGEAQFYQQYPQYAVYRNGSYFSTFGGGHDIFGGTGILGTYYGDTSADWRDGYTYSHSYDQSQGQISVAGDSGYGGGDSGIFWDEIGVLSLEVYTIADAQNVPAPTPLGLMVAGLIALGLRRYGLTAIGTRRN